VLYGKIRIEMDEADLIVRALNPDDLKWSYCRLEGKDLVIEIKTEKIGAMINAIEDYFINLKAVSSVQKILNEIK